MASRVCGAYSQTGHSISRLSEMVRKDKYENWIPLGSTSSSWLQTSRGANVRSQNEREYGLSSKPLA